MPLGSRCTCIVFWSLLSSLPEAGDALQDYDGAEPAATSVAACNLTRLSALLEHGSGSFSQRAQQAVASVSGRYGPEKLEGPAIR